MNIKKYELKLIIFVWKNVSWKDHLKMHICWTFGLAFSDLFTTFFFTVTTSRRKRNIRACVQSRCQWFYKWFSLKYKLWQNTPETSTVCKLKLIGLCVHAARVKNRTRLFAHLIITSTLIEKKCTYGLELLAEHLWRRLSQLVTFVATMKATELRSLNHPPSPCRAFDAKINHSFENQTSALASRKCRGRNYIRAVM